MDIVRGLSRIGIFLGLKFGRNWKGNGVQLHLLLLVRPVLRIG